MKDPKITAVLFDWDLTLARVLGDVSEDERLTALFRSQGLNYTLAEVQSAVKKYQNGTRQETSARISKPQRRRDIIHSYFEILSHLGHNHRDWTFGNRLYDAHSRLPTFLYDDALPTLQTLHQKGFPLGIISNHAHSAREMIERSVGDFIPPERIIISQEIGVHKPAKTIFRRAIGRVGVPPANCMFVGNNLSVDAIGAVEQGEFGRGLWLDREGIKLSEALPDGVFQITSLNQVVDYL